MRREWSALFQKIRLGALLGSQFFPYLAVDLLVDRTHLRKIFAKQGVEPRPMAFEDLMNSRALFVRQVEFVQRPGTPWHPVTNGVEPIGAKPA